MQFNQLAGTDVRLSRVALGGHEYLPNGNSRGFNEDFWFTNGGLPHTDQLKLVERFTRTDLDTLNYEVSVDDPGAYTRPWKASWTLRWVADQELPRQLCQDNRP